MYGISRRVPVRNTSASTAVQRAWHRTSLELATWANGFFFWFLVCVQYPPPHYLDSSARKKHDGYQRYVVPSVGLVSPLPASLLTPTRSTSTGLTKLLQDEAPASIKGNDIKSYFGRKVAIDASMSLYQFLIAIRQDGVPLMTTEGETTSHLIGFFYRTLRMIEMGIKPMYVFDGQPPDLKKAVLTQRFGKREEARQDEDEEKDVGTCSLHSLFASQVPGWEGKWVS